VFELDTTQNRDGALVWLLDLEKNVDGLGWGRPASLWVLSSVSHFLDDIGAMAVEVYSFNLPSCSEMRPDLTPTEYLRFLAETLRAQEPLRQSMYARTVKGDLRLMVMVAETWQIPEHDMEAWAARPWEEHPEAWVTRIVWGADAHGGLYACHRAQGSDTTQVVHNGRPDFPTGIDMSVFHGVADLLAAFGGTR
jgi:hypothetical protein